MLGWILLASAGAFMVGLAGGFLWGHGRTSNKQVTQLRAQLDAAQQELSEYRDRVVDHFKVTGDLVNHLTESYRSVYRHLAEGARDLCGNENLALIAVREERLPPAAANDQPADDQANTAGQDRTPDDETTDAVAQPVQPEPAQPVANAPARAFDSDEDSATPVRQTVH